MKSKASSPPTAAGLYFEIGDASACRRAVARHLQGRVMPHRCSQRPALHRGVPIAKVPSRRRQEYERPGHVESTGQLWFSGGELRSPGQAEACPTKSNLIDILLKDLSKLLTKIFPRDAQHSRLEIIAGHLGAPTPIRIGLQSAPKDLVRQQPPDLRQQKSPFVIRQRTACLLRSLPIREE